MHAADHAPLTLDGIQLRIRETFGAKDEARGPLATFVWLAEEFGELATALRSGTRDELAAEMADVLAWLATLANVCEIDLSDAFSRKYRESCPACGRVPCACAPHVKP